LRKSVLLSAISALVLAATFTHAQQLDVAFGVSTTLSSSNYNSSSQSFPLQAEKGGAYPGVSAGVVFKNRLGFNGEVNWKATQGLYDGYQPYRPIFYDFNALYQPKIGKKAGLDLMAGVGGESIRFYQQYYNCSYFSCTDYVSSNHFMGHVGGGIRYYVWHRFFIRPEAHLYLIHNNAEFSSGYVGRVGASIGYSLSPEY
jgi:hypothetical protein